MTATAMLDARAATVIANRYRLLRKLGQGGMGSVWQAEDHALRIEVAVKLLDSSVESSEMLARFEREAHAAALLRSTHIVHINDYGVDQESNTPYIAMDLLEGESLSALLRRQKRLSFEHARRLLLQVAQALRLAHEKKIAHRDLKPDNVFIARECELEVVKVLDFGIAKRLEPRSIRATVETQVGQILGTPYYMSPEQAQARADIDHRTDIWSFGVIAYECVTGMRPFDEHNVAAVMARMRKESIPVPSQAAPVPAGFDAWFARAVAPDRDERFPSIEEAAALLSVIGQQAAHRARGGPRVPHCEPSLSSPSPSTSRLDPSLVVSSITPAATRPVPRNPSLRLATVALLLALVAVGAYLIFATPSTLRAAFVTHSEVSGQLPPSGQKDSASVPPLPASVQAPVASQTAEPSSTTGTNVSQPAARLATSADTDSSAPRATSKRKHKRAISPATLPSTGPTGVEPAPTSSREDHITASPPEEYDPGI